MLATNRNYLHSPGVHQRRVFFLRALVFLFLILGLAACSAPVYAPVFPEAMNSPAKTQVYVATNRGKNSEGHFDRERATTQLYLQQTISLPSDRSPGEVPQISNTPDFEKHYAVAAQKDFDTVEDFARDIRKTVGPKGEVTVFVHGFYNSYVRSLYRVAQVKQDFGMPGAAVNFSWPSAGRALAYNYDNESILFARDDLETLLLALAKHGPENIIIVGHSRGTLLVMETLRQMEIRQPGWSDRNMTAVVMISPDEPLDVFQRALERFEKVPQPFFIMTTGKDKALRFSNRINGSQERVGQITDPAQFGDLPVILLDVSNFSMSQNNNHSLFAESPALISLFRDQTTFETLVDTMHTEHPTALEQTVRVFGDAIAVELSPTDDIGPL